MADLTCPCADDKPDPCTLCGARVNFDMCGIDAVRARIDAATQAEIVRLQAIAADAQELLDIFIEGGYIEDGDEALINRLHAALHPEVAHA